MLHLLAGNSIALTILLWMVQAWMVQTWVSWYLLGHESRGRYVRAVEIARRDDEGEPPGEAYDRALAYPNRRVPSVDRLDARLDSSLLGLVWPFRTRVRPERVRATLDAIADGLAAPGGGLLRHEGDVYAGGHEWPLVTLWQGLSARALGDGETHRATLAHVVSRRTALDLLPEQVFPDGSPAWVLPLGWSHAMLLCAARAELALLQEHPTDDAGHREHR